MFGISGGSCSFPELQEVHQLGTQLGVIPKLALDTTFTQYLSSSSSTHLSSHYAAVQCPLTPEQLTVFHHSLRSTFGETQKVTMGGVGVVAMALSLLFDLLAQQAKNKHGTSDPIQRIFGEGGGSNVSETGTVIGDYLKLVPRIANDPERMKKETERYRQKLNITLSSHLDRMRITSNYTFSDIMMFIHGATFHQHMEIHLARLGVAIPREQLTENNWKKNTEHWESPAKMEHLLNFIKKLQTISPENHDLLQKCEDSELLLQINMVVDAIRNLGFFFYGYSSKYTDSLVSQKDDFFLKQ